MENTPTPSRIERMRRPQKGLPRFRYRDEHAELADARVSVRRWWWEYLRLSKDYWLLCKTSSASNARTLDDRLQQIYKKFGNVHDCTFDEWWLKRGAHVFKEQTEPPKVIEIAHDLSNLTEYRDEMVLVDIPLALSRATIHRKINEILKKYELQRPQNKLEISKSEFPINPVRYRMHTLQAMHEVYCLHRELIAKPIALEMLDGNAAENSFAVRADLFRIGKLLRISPSNEQLRGTEIEIRKKQNVMRASVSRYLKRADQLISNVEYGKFPVFKDVKLPEHRFTKKHSQNHLEYEREWWELDLTSTLSVNKVDEARRLHYSEPLKVRTNY
jgi:hypothetical protein